MTLKYFLGVLFVLHSFSAISQYPFQSPQQYSHCSCKKVPLADTISLIKQTARIEAISFVDLVEVVPDAKSDPYLWKEYNKTKIKRKARVQIWNWLDNSLQIRLDSSVIQERKALTEKESQRLYKVLFQYVSDSTAFAPVDEAFCYFPHHGFIFYNRINKPFAYLEVCFGCNRAYGTKGFYFGDYCENKNDLVIAFLKSLGWHYQL